MAEERVAAFDALIELSPPIAKAILLAVAERNAEPKPVLEAAGLGLARLELVGVKVNEFDLRNVSEVAFHAWADWQPPK